VFEPEKGLIALAFAVNLLVGYVFALSAATKWRNPDNFALHLSRFPWPLPKNGLHPLAYGVVMFETLLAAAFAFNLGDGYRHGLAVVALCFFTAFLVLNRAELQTTGCACFGERSALNRYPIARNLTLLALVLLPLMLGAELSLTQSLVQSLIFVLSAAIGFALGGASQSLDSLMPAEAGSLPVLYLSYRLNGYKEADELLAVASSRRMLVVLEAPDWMVEAKRDRWPSHRVVAAAEPVPGGEAFLLRRNSKGRIQRYSEWAAYAARYIRE
jgi:hypothetical protein